MKKKLLSSSCFFLAFLCLTFYLNSCKSSQGRQRSGDGGGGGDGGGDEDKKANLWKYQDIVRFQIWQPDYKDRTEQKGWQDFIIKDGEPPANKKGWFIRQGKIADEKTQKRNFYVDFIAVKKDENKDGDLSRSEIKKGEPFYLKTNTHCVDTGYCFLERSHYPNKLLLQPNNDVIKFITTEKNHDIKANASDERLEFFIEEDSIEFGKQFRLYTEFDNVKYFLASYTSEDHDGVIETTYHKRIALVRKDIYETSDKNWKKIKTEFTSGFRSPKKDGEYANNLKVEKCDKKCQTDNNQPHGELSTKEALCSTKDTTLKDKPGTSFCYHGVNRIEGFYEAAKIAQKASTITGGAAAMLFTLFGQPEISAAILGGAAFIKKTEQANEPTRKALRFSYDACHEICYDTLKKNQNEFNSFYEKMAKLKSSEDELETSTTSKDDVKWKKKDNTNVTILEDMKAQAESLSEGTEAAPFVQAGIKLLCAVMKDKDNDEIKTACEKMYPK